MISAICDFKTNNHMWFEKNNLLDQIEKYIDLQTFKKQPALNCFVWDREINVIGS